MSRKLYDLCRKYKYFYNKHEDVKEWDQKYYDIDLSDALAKTKIDLGLVEHEIQKELFNVFNVNCISIEMNNTFDGVYSRDFLCRLPITERESNVMFRDSNRFINILSEYLYEEYKRLEL